MGHRTLLHWNLPAARAAARSRQANESEGARNSGGRAYPALAPARHLVAKALDGIVQSAALQGISDLQEVQCLGRAAGRKRLDLVAQEPVNGGDDAAHHRHGGDDGDADLASLEELRRLLPLRA